jgi:hypothetical protein
MMNCKGSGRRRSLPNLSYYLSILRATTKILTQNSRYPGKDLNPDIPNTKRECWPIDKDVRCRTITLLGEIWRFSLPLVCSCVAHRSAPCSCRQAVLCDILYKFSTSQPCHFNREDGNRMFLRNVDIDLRNHGTKTENNTNIVIVACCLYVCKSCLLH